MFDKNLLKSELVLKDLTLEKLGKLLGLSKPTMSKKLNGVSEFTLSEIQALSKILGEEKGCCYFFCNKSFVKETKRR